VSGFGPIDVRSTPDTNGLNRLNEDQIAERGARMNKARRPRIPEVTGSI